MRNKCPMCKGLGVPVMMKRPLCDECDEELFTQWINRQKHDCMIDILARARTLRARARRGAKVVDLDNLRCITKKL